MQECDGVLAQAIRRPQKQRAEDFLKEHYSRRLFLATNPASDPSKEQGRLRLATHCQLSR